MNGDGRFVAKLICGAACGGLLLAGGAAVLAQVATQPSPTTQNTSTHGQARRDQGGLSRAAGGAGPRGGFPGGFGAYNPGPTPAPAGVTLHRKIPYVENGSPNQVMNLYLPSKPADKPLPLLIWIHPGAWLGGSYNVCPVAFLATKGFAVASIEHRFSWQAKWPAQAYDCKAAVRFLRANAAKYNLDPDHFGVGGESSGGHLAAFLGTSGGVTSMEGELGNPNVSSSVQAVVDLFGPTDFTQMDQQNGGKGLQHNTPYSPESMLLGGPLPTMRELAETANPITYISANDPPFLIMHGDKDQLMPHGQSVILAKALIDAGVEVTMKTLHGAGHGDPQFHSPENLREIEDFLTEHLKPVG